MTPTTNIVSPTHKPRRSTLRNALIITRREVRDSFRDWRIVAPIIILTLVFPALAQYLAQQFAGFLEGYGATIIGERTIPFLLMIVGFFPISISLVIALETFVGEKERRSLEPLLSTPLTNTELYIGKTLSAMIPPLVASFGGMMLYLFNALSGELAWRPQPMLLIQIILLTIVQALVMITGAVVVSSQTTSTRAANLLASFIIIPMTLIINGESFIMFIAPDADSAGGIGSLWAIIIAMIVVTILLLRVGSTLFNREELLGRTIDSINLGSMFKRIFNWIIAVDDEATPAHNLLDWYRRAIPYSLSKLKVPVVLTVGVFLSAFIVGYIFSQQPQWRIPLPESQTYDSVSDTFAFITQQSLKPASVAFIIWQNGRVLLLALILSIFSLGVAAFVIPPAVYAILGFLLGQLLLAGYDLALFLAAIVPHGIVEIPMIVLATAAMFRLGAISTRPPQGMTVGQAWTMALGDTIKLAIGVIIPMMFVAAILEAYVTPVIVSQIVR
ncbi:MAG: stage II sporulation protein M [Anaerolineaceae bacterium]|nr:stage II sporulation protein M [Anaerolineaceae bacterium]